MLSNQKILGLIPARGGSKGIPKKNLAELGGQTLLERTIRIASQSRYIDRLVLSSEDKDIIKEAERCGCEVPFVRPIELATDEASGMDPVFHAIDNIPGFDYIVLLQVTSPFRTTKDIDGCILKCFDEAAPASVSIMQTKNHPLWMFKKNEDDILESLMHGDNVPSRRQNLPLTYVLNGAVYCAKIEFLKENKTFLGPKTCGYVMPQDRSIDIDTPQDLEFARYFFNSKM